MEPDGRGVVAEPRRPCRRRRGRRRPSPGACSDRRTRPAPPPRSPGRGPCTGTRTRAGRSPAGTANQVSPVPWRIARRCRPSRSSNGVSRSIPCASASAAIIRANGGFAAKSGQTATAPSRRLRRPSGISTAGLAPCCDAQPLADRAPAERAVEREVVRRQLLEAPAAAVAGRGAGCSGRRASCGSSASSPTWATWTTPLPRSSADSTESASRDRVDAADDRRGRRRPRSGACGGGSAWAARRG